MQAPAEQHAAASTAIASPQHLKNWLAETNRTYLTFNALDLVDALRWPDGVQTLMQVIDAYRTHREATPTGEKVVRRPEQGAHHVVPEMKTERLTSEELRTCIQALTQELQELENTTQMTA